MAEFDIEDLIAIDQNKEILDLLIENKIVKKHKFKEQLDYEIELNKLQVELNKMQQDIIQKNKRMLIIFEGRDAAGKGGTIGRTREFMDPKKAKVVALPKPTELENSQWYFQRYFLHLPRYGEIVFFDRSWYNRAVVEPVFGFCTKEQHELFMEQVKDVEKLLIEDGIILIKFFLSISKKEQKERLEERRKEVLKQWKIGALDEQAQEKWDEFTGYIEKMLKKTSGKKTPWTEVITDDKKEARIDCIKHILNTYYGKEKYETKNIKTW